MTLSEYMQLEERAEAAGIGDWHAEARDWAQIAMLTIDAVEDMARDRNGKL